MSAKSEHLERLLESRGFPNPIVLWKPLEKAAEMCGPTGGWMFLSGKDEDNLGINFEMACRMAGMLKPTKRSTAIREKGNS